MTSMSIPAIRAELLRLADTTRGFLVADDLRRLAEASFRKPAVRKTRRRLPGLTAELASNIRDYAASNPDKSQLDVANRFSVNPGRVSEALNGLR